MNRLRALEVFVVWPPVLDGDRPKPSAIGLGDELAELLDHERVGRATWTRWIRAYVRFFGYLTELQRPGSRRHDINGLPLEEVDESHRQHAREQLVEHARLAKARHQAELDAKRHQGPASSRIRT